MKEQRDLVRKANQCANQCAADAFIARLEERLYFDGAAQNSGVGAMKDPANVEEIPAEINREKKGTTQCILNTGKLKNKRGMIIYRNHPLRLIMGKDNGSSPDNNQAQGQSVAWAHRTILGQTARSVQQ